MNSSNSILDILNTGFDPDILRKIQTEQIKEAEKKKEEKLKYPFPVRNIYFPTINLVVPFGNPGYNFWENKISSSTEISQRYLFLSRNISSEDQVREIMVRENPVCRLYASCPDNGYPAIKRLTEDKYVVYQSVFIDSPDVYNYQYLDSIVYTFTTNIRLYQSLAAEIKHEDVERICREIRENGIVDDIYRYTEEFREYMYRQVWDGK